MTTSDRDVLADDSPLNDPSYQPQHRPVRGVIPPVVEKWGARSQVRWFARYGREIKAMPSSAWDQFHVDSSMHKGMCCESCIEDANEGHGLYDPEVCCCVGLRAQDAP